MAEPVGGSEYQEVLNRLADFKADITKRLDKTDADVSKLQDDRVKKEDFSSYKMDLDDKLLKEYVTKNERTPYKIALDLFRKGAAILLSGFAVYIVNLWKNVFGK